MISLIMVTSLALGSCKYGSDNWNKKQLSELSHNLKQHIMYPWFNCHYNGVSVSCEELEKLTEKEKKQDPNLKLP